MSPAFRHILILLGVLTIAVVAWTWFINTWEKVPYDEWVGFSGEARTNDYLAAQRLLVRLGVATESVANLHDKDGLPPRDGTLFVPVWRSTFSRARISQLQQWVAAGGHLVVIGRMGYEDHVGARKDELLDPLGVTVDRPPQLEEEDGNISAADDDADGGDYYEEEEDVAQAEEDLECDEDTGEECEKPVKETFEGDLGKWLQEMTGQTKSVETQVRIPDVDEPLTITGWAQEKQWELIDEEGRAVWAMPGDEHYMLLQLEVGEGVLTILRGASFMTNRLIGEKDNAEFLWRLATWNGRRGGSWIIYGYDVPSLLTLLVDRGGMLLLGLVLLLLLWLWRHVLRFGPLHPLPIPPRRSVMEHVDASGRFLWRHGQRRALLEVVQSALLTRATRRISDWQRLDEPDRHARLAEIASLSVAEVRVALSTAVPQNGAQFTQSVQRLEEIRRAL